MSAERLPYASRSVASNTKRKPSSNADSLPITNLMPHSFAATCANNTCYRAFVSDCKCGVAEPVRAQDQFFRMRCATEKGEVGEAVKFGVVMEHNVCTRYESGESSETRKRRLDAP